MQKGEDMPRWTAFINRVLCNDPDGKSDDRKSEKGGVNGAATETAKKQA